MAIYSNQTHNNLILEEDAGLMTPLPSPPSKSCYMGGWIVPPLISKAGKVTIDVKPKNGLNKIDYNKFKIITTHALFIKGHEEATELLDMTIQPEKLKNPEFISELKSLNAALFVVVAFRMLPKEVYRRYICCCCYCCFSSEHNSSQSSCSNAT